MFKWMVALDGSDNAREAFYTTLNLMDKRRDELFLVSTVQSTPVSVGGYQKYSDEIEETHRKYLLDYGRRCDEEGVRYYNPILARGSHIGRMICAAAEKKGVDFLVVGRRGMNRFSRLVAGSTSKHLMENAPCNVIVVKGYFLAEERGPSAAEVQKLEEQERQRRIQEFAGKKEEHYCSREEIKAIEERERLRRMREREDEDTRVRQGEQTAGMIRHLRELEEERLSRGEATQQYTGRLGDRIERLQSE
jgi:nucleotide-binding universal stress UspA family protein